MTSKQEMACLSTFEATEKADTCRTATEARQLMDSVEVGSDIYQIYERAWTELTLF